MAFKCDIKNQFGKNQKFRIKAGTEKTMKTLTSLKLYNENNYKRIAAFYNIWIVN